jgi:hypothetical protein
MDMWCSHFWACKGRSPQLVLRQGFTPGTRTER